MWGGPLPRGAARCPFQRHFDHNQGSLRPPSAPLHKAQGANNFQGFLMLPPASLSPVVTQLVTSRSQTEEVDHISLQVPQRLLLHLVFRRPWEAAQGLH